MLVDNLAICSFDCTFLEQDALKISYNPGGDSIQHVVVILIPPDWSLISRVLNFASLSILHHTDHLVELQCLIGVEGVEALFTHKVIVQVGVLGL